MKIFAKFFIFLFFISCGDSSIIENPVDKADFSTSTSSLSESSNSITSDASTTDTTTTDFDLDGVPDKEDGDADNDGVINDKDGDPFDSKIKEKDAGQEQVQDDVPAPEEDDPNIDKALMAELESQVNSWNNGSVDALAMAKKLQNYPDQFPYAEDILIAGLILSGDTTVKRYHRNIRILLNLQYMGNKGYIGKPENKATLEKLKNEFYGTDLIFKNRLDTVLKMYP